MLVCPRCGFEKEPERKLEFCPRDGSAMRLKQVLLTAPTPEFQVGLRNMLQKLSPGTELPTIGEHETFRVLRITSTEVVIAPLSTMKERPISIDQIRSVYRRWLGNGRSYTSSDYTGLTVNSVYTLRLISEYWDTDTKATRDLKVHFANRWTVRNPEERIREYTEVEAYRGYDDAHTVNNEITLADIHAVDRLYAQIMRFRKETAELIIRSETIREQLQRVDNIELGAITDSEWPRMRRSARNVLSAFLKTKGVGLAVATKLLHLKRPKLFPILDNYVVSFLLGEKAAKKMASAASKDIVLRLGLKALQAARTELLRNAAAFEQLSESLKDLPVPLEKVRMFGILCWTTEKWNVRKELSAPHGTPSRSIPLAKHSDKPHN